MSQTKYLTQYRARSTIFYEHVWADDVHDAQRAIVERKMSESLLGEYPDSFPEYKRASEMFRAVMCGADLAVEAAHALVHLGHMAVACGLCLATEDVLGDAGWLHRALHFMLADDREGWEHNYQRIQAIERVVPGHLPDEIRHQQYEELRNER